MTLQPSDLLAITRPAGLEAGSYQLPVAALAEQLGTPPVLGSSGILWSTVRSAADNSWEALCWSPELQLYAAVAGTGSGKLDHSASRSPPPEELAPRAGTGASAKPMFTTGVSPRGSNASATATLARLASSPRPLDHEREDIPAGLGRGSLGRASNRAQGCLQLVTATAKMALTVRAF